MRDALSRRYRMYLTVKDTLDDFAAVIDATPAIKERATDFRSQFDAIYQRIDTGVSGTEAVTEIKNQSLERVGNACFELANALWTYADEHKDEMLKAKFPLALSEYQYGKEVDLLARFHAVVTAGLALKRELRPYGFSEDKVDQVADYLRDFSEKMNTPRAARAANSLKLSDFIGEFKAMDALLKRLDRAIFAVMTEQPAFYQAYTKARTLGTPSSKKDTMPTAEQRNRAFVPPNLPTPNNIANEVKEYGSGFSRPQ